MYGIIYMEREVKAMDIKKELDKIERNHKIAFNVGCVIIGILWMVGATALVVAYSLGMI